MPSWPLTSRNFLAFMPARRPLYATDFDIGDDGIFRLMPPRGLIGCESVVAASPTVFILCRRLSCQMLRSRLRYLFCFTRWLAISIFRRCFDNILRADGLLKREDVLHVMCQIASASLPLADAASRIISLRKFTAFAAATAFTYQECARFLTKCECLCAKRAKKLTYLLAGDIDFAQSIYVRYDG